MLCHQAFVKYPGQNSFMKEAHPKPKMLTCFLQITGYHSFFNLPKITQEAIIAAAAVVITKKIVT